MQSATKIVQKITSVVIPVKRNLPFSWRWVVRCDAV